MRKLNSEDEGAVVGEEASGNLIPEEPSLSQGFWCKFFREAPQCCFSQQAAVLTLKKGLCGHDLSVVLQFCCQKTL